MDIRQVIKKLIIEQLTEVTIETTPENLPTVKKTAGEEDIIKVTAEERLAEILDKNSELKDYIDDFLKSDASQFDGKSKDERRKMAIAAYLNEKKGKDLDGDGDVDSDDYLKARDIAIKKNMQKEDIDLGHQDNEPGMLKSDLYHIGKYAMELYKIIDSLEDKGEIDFPHWWQSKIIKSKSMLSSAKHYLEFEIKEPQIDAMVGVAAEEDIIN